MTVSGWLTALSSSGAPVDYDVSQWRGEESDKLQHVASSTNKGVVERGLFLAYFKHHSKDQILFVCVCVCV